MASTSRILRAQLRSQPSNGHISFIPQIRKLVFEHCENWPSSVNLRSFILRRVEDLARENPHVEIVVRHRPYKQPVIRGFYLNGRNKTIGLKGFEVPTIEQKVQLLLDSSGAKIKPLKGRPVESTTESARGIWSGLHVEQPFRI
jgi:large subunit ribosomal protein L43